MDNIIIGTAGHVDHGKTLLVKALTGIETDRLAEEKKRGITIELGFAYLDLPNGGRAGIIDAPGHEKFIKNMLAGAGSIDLAILVVAADEGIMPQTKEHLDILNMLDIKQGIVALNKVDLVDQAWLEMVMLDIEEELKGSFFQDAKIIPVSAYSGYNIDVLKNEIFAMLAQSAKKPIDLDFRLPIDRVFTMEGFGTVVTGTVLEGIIKLSDIATLYPVGTLAKIRRIQVHGKDTTQAFAGQRAAINLAGLKRSDIAKGDTLAASNSMVVSHILDVSIEILKDCKRDILNNSRLHLYHGTRGILCKLTILEKEMLKAGEQAYAQLRLLEPLAVKPGDRFVLRFYSPLETIGGGKVLYPTFKKARKQDKKTLEYMQIKDKGELKDKIATIVLENSKHFLRQDYIKKYYFCNDKDFEVELEGLLTEGAIYTLQNILIHRKYAEVLGQKAQNILKKYHKLNPLHRGMPIKELHSQILPKNITLLLDHTIKMLQNLGFLYIVENLAAHKDFKFQINEEHGKIQQYILNKYLENRFAPQNIDAITDEFNKQYPKLKGDFKKVLDSLRKSERLIMLNSQIYMHKDYYDKALESFATLQKANQEVTLGDFRDALGVSRKFALAFLEYFDKKGITKMVGEGRKLVI